MYSKQTLRVENLILRNIFGIPVAIGLSPDGFDYVAAAFNLVGRDGVNSMEDNATEGNNTAV